MFFPHFGVVNSSWKEFRLQSKVPQESLLIHITRVDALPRLFNGKIDYRSVHRLVLSAPSFDQLSEPEQIFVTHVLAKQPFLSDHIIGVLNSTQATLAQLGLDSLQRAELLVNLAQVNKVIMWFDLTKKSLSGSRMQFSYQLRIWKLHLPA